MVDDVQDNLEPHQQRADCDAADVSERARVVRERREAEQRRRLDELRAHAAAAQAQRDQRDAERRRRAMEQRVKEDDRRHQVEERKRAIWEAGHARREALVRRDRERDERIERQRAARSCGSRTQVFAFGSSTPRMLEPADTGGIFWGHRSPVEMNFFESLASSTSNVMFSSAPLTRRSSTFDLDRAEREKKDESNEGQAPAAMWSSVARRKTDLVPTIPAPRPPGRAYSMTRLDRIQPQRTLQHTSPSMVHLNRNHLRSGETTPGSRPGSAMSTSVSSVRRPNSTPRRPRPASIAGTPRGVEVLSMDSTPTVSRDATSTNMGGSGGAVGGGDGVVRRPNTARRPRPASMHATPTTPLAAGDGKPPMHRKPKLPKDNEKTPHKGAKSATLQSDSSKEPSVENETHKTPVREKRDRPSAQKLSEPRNEMNQVSAKEVTQKLEALQLKEMEAQNQPQTQIADSTPQQPETAEKIETVKQNGEEIKSSVEINSTEVQSVGVEKSIEVEHQVETQLEKQQVDEQKPEIAKPEAKKEEKPVAGQEKAEEVDMTASMIARNRITTEEEAKAALAERRRKAREELERQAELERQRLAKEAEEEAERQRQEDERQRQLEEEARELAELQRKNEEEKLRKAIEAQQQLEREARERAAREEAERLARLKEEEEERRAREVAEVAKREEAEREEAERRVRRQRVEAIMLRTRQKKAEEDKKQQENNKNSNAPESNQSDGIDNTPMMPETRDPDNGNAEESSVDLLGLANSDNANTQSHIIQSTLNLIDAERNSNEKVYDNEIKNLDVSNNVDLLSSHIAQPLVNVDNSQVDLLSSQMEGVKVQNGESKEENGYTIRNGHKESSAIENVLNNGGSQYPLTLHNAV